MKLKRTPNSSQKRISEIFQNVKRNAPKIQAARNGRRSRREADQEPGHTALSRPIGKVRNQAMKRSNSRPTNKAAKVGSPQDTPPTEATSRPRRKSEPRRT